MQQNKFVFWPDDEWSLCNMLDSSQGTCTPLADDITIDNTTIETDDIRIISTQIIHLEIPVASSLGINSTIETTEEEFRRKRINRIVGFFASLIFLTCVVLVCSSLMMSKNIDQLGKFTLLSTDFRKK